MDVEGGSKSLTRIVETTREQLHKHRAAGVSDEDFVLRLLNEFVRMRSELSHNAGSLHMALSCYHMALMSDYVDELEDKVEFYKDSIDFLMDLQDS